MPWRGVLVTRAALTEAGRAGRLRCWRRAGAGAGVAVASARARVVAALAVSTGAATMEARDSGDVGGIGIGRGRIVSGHVGAAAEERLQHGRIIGVLHG